MLLSFLPAWGAIAALAIVLIAKYFLIAKIEKSPFYAAQVTGKGWMATLLIISGLNAIVTGALLLLVTGLFWAVVITILDFALHFLTGYYKIKKALPKIDAGNVDEAKSWFASATKWIAALHGTSYISIAVYVYDFVAKHPEWATKALAFLHLS